MKFFLPLVVFVGLACNRVQPAVRLDINEPAYLYQSAVQVQVDIKVAVPPTTVVPGTQPPAIEVSRESTVFGSGVVIGYKRILTAAHVCIADADKPGRQVLQYSVRGVVGQQIPAFPIWTNADTDLCVLEIQSSLGIPVQLVSVAPSLGSLIYFVAGPNGLFGDGVGILDQGHFGGELRISGQSRYILGATSTHGASGAGVFYRGRLLGIVVGIMTSGGYLVGTTTLEQVVEAVKASSAISTKFLSR